MLIFTGESLLMEADGNELPKKLTESNNKEKMGKGLKNSCTTLEEASKNVKTITVIQAKRQCFSSSTMI